MKKVLSVFLVAVMLLGVLPVLPMAERAEAVTGIEYEKESPVICYFETSGSFDTNNQGEQYFRYEGFGFSTGDVLVVYYEGLAEPVRYTAEYNQQERRIEYIAEDGDVITTSDLHIESNQQEQPFTIGDDNYYYVCYKTFKAPVQVTVVDSPVKKVEFIPGRELVLYENTDGEWRTDDNGEYFEYNNPGFENGDVIRLTLTGDVIADYTYGYNEEDDEYFFYNSEGEALDRDVLYTTKGSNGRWSLGNENRLYIIYKDVYSSPVTVTIIQNPVKSIKFTKANAAQYVEGTNMYYDTWDDAYYYDEPRFETGDVLTVTDNNNVEKAYTFNEESDSFIASDGDEIDSIDVDRFSDQRQTPWTIGNNNAYFVEYMGHRSTALYVTITANPVKAISFVPAKQAQYIEGTNMWYDDYDGVSYYDIPGFEVGDILKVTDNNNVTTSYVYGYGEDYSGVFTASNGKTISALEVETRSEQRETPWTVGENEYFIRYSGKTCSAKVTITSNPVDSIEYTPKTPAVLVEGQNMWYDDYEDEYYYDVPRMETGDILTVHYNDGRGIVAYTLQYDEENDENYFVSAGGDRIKVDWDTVHTINTQRDKAWTLGSDNLYYIEYCGQRAEVPVTIIENNVKQISFKLQKEITVFATDCRTFIDDNGYEHKEYNIPEFEEGDILTITDKNGESKDYVFTFDESDGEHYFVNGNEKIHRYALDIDPYLLGDDWEVGEYNYFTVSYMGAEAQIEVNVIETDVKSISFKKATDVIITENQGGRWCFNDFGHKFYLYEPMLGNVGDVLTVNYLNGTSISYTVKFDVQSNTAYLEAPNGDRLTTDDVDVYENQYENPWTPGGDNVYYVKFHGVTTTVPVTVNHDYAESVIKPKANAVGYTLHTCKGCSESYKSNYTAPTGKISGLKCASRTATAQKFTWTKMSGAKGYQIQLLNSANKQVAIKTLSANSFTFSKLTAGTLYKARVRFYITADGKNYYSAWSAVVTSPTLPAASSLTKLTPAKKAFTAQWKKVAVTGYQLQYATNAKFTKATTKTLKGAAKVKLAIKTPRGGTRYYVRVRTFKTIGGKNYYSTWSGAKAVTTKK